MIPDAAATQGERTAPSLLKSQQNPQLEAGIAERDENKCPQQAVSMPEPPGKRRSSTGGPPSARR